MSKKKNLMKEYQKTLITPATMKKALLEARGELSDQDVFLSAAYRRQLNSLGSYLVGRTGRKDIAISARVEWDDGDDPFTAYTDNKAVVLNAAYPDIQKRKRRIDRHMCIMGMACHEFAHCLFTDFTQLKRQYEAFMDGNLYPGVPKITPANEQGLDGIQNMLEKGPLTRRVVAQIYKNLDNVIEDAYIERSLIVLHMGDAKKSLKMLNQAFFGEDFMESIRRKEVEDPALFQRGWSIFQNALLTLLKMGAVNLDPAYHPVIADIHNRLCALAPRLMREVENSNVRARKELALDLILENWDLLEGEINYELSQMSEEEKAIANLADEELEEILKHIIENALENIGADHEKHNNSNSGLPVRVFIEQPAPSQENGEENTDDATNDEGGKDENSSPADSENGKNAVIRITPEDDSFGGDDSMRKTLNSIETELSKQTAEEKTEKQLRQTLQQNANGSAVNDTWSVEIIRPPEIPQDGIDRYEYIWPKISPVSKSLKKELLKILRERRQGSKLTGLIHGRRLDTRSLYRTDEKYFSKTRLPSDRPTVATALLIDQSGSMCRHANDSSGQGLFQNKIQAASNAALLLYDFCVDLGFPIMVAGHTTDFGSKVILEVMAAFQKVDKQDRYRICNAKALYGNRDGTALNYMLSELKKRPEEIKLLFIISDGLPSDYFSGEDGVAHLQAVLADAQKSGVLTFAAALDEDIPQLREIYGENMFEMTDLARMPRTLLNVMKRFVK